MCVAIFFLLTGLLTAPAQALCGYGGVEYAQTTLSQEFKDARWVVKAKVVGAQNHFSDDEPGAPFTLYQLEVLEIFKGRPEKTLRFFTYRNSAGFYFETYGFRGNHGGEYRPDIDGEYLLFLNPLVPTKSDPAATRGAVFVNYACGQSKRWDMVSAAEQAKLKALTQWHVNK